MYFLTITNNATDVIASLYKDTICCGTNTLSYKQASACLLTNIEALLGAKNLTLIDLAFIAANAGPAPYTTLRTILTTVNGIGYASTLPLIAVNGIETLVREHYRAEYTHTFGLLNAFCDDVYYAYYDYAANQVTTGTCPIGTYLENLQQFLTSNPQARIHFVGSGFMMHEALFTHYFNQPIMAYTSIPMAGSTDAIAQAAYTQWRNKEGLCAQITPWYGKPYQPQSSKKS